MSAGFFSSIAQQWTAVTGGSWPASIFIGVAFVAFLVLVGSAALMAYRVFRPLPPPSGTSSGRQKPSEEQRHSEQLQRLNRTAFLLTTAAVEAHYRHRLEEGLIWFRGHPRSPPFETNEQLGAEVARVQEFISDLQSNLAPSHWTAELYRVISNAEREASYDEESMTVPEGLNPFQYRRFHIACLQYDRIGQFLERSIVEAKSQQRQMAQMIRDRPDIHK